MYTTHPTTLHYPTHIHSLTQVVKVIVKIVHKAELALLKINDKLFGPMLGPIMDKLEMALIESIPGVGQVVKVVVEGVDIADKVDAVGKCWKARDFGCVGNAVGGIVEDVSGAMTNKAVRVMWRFVRRIHPSFPHFHSYIASHMQGHMSNFAKTIVNDGKFVETACVVAKDVYETYDALDEVVEVVKHHGKPAEVIQALGDLGGVLGDVDKSLSGISTTQKVRQRGAHVLTREVCGKGLENLNAERF